MTEKQTIVISAHQLDNIQSCPRLYYYANILNIVSIESEESKRSDRGILLHHLLDIHYKSIILSKGLTLSNEQILPGVELMRDLALNKATELSLTLDEASGIIKLYEEYRNFYPIQSDWEIEASEVEFAKVIYEDEDVRIIDQGKIDLLVKHKRLSNLQIVVDHKYSSKNYPTSGRDTQNLNYCLVTGRRDFVINQLGDQKTLPIEKRMVRTHYCYGDHQIEEFKNDVIYWTLETVRTQVKAMNYDYIPANRRSCMKFGKKCTYFDLCETTPDNVEYKIKAEFIRRKERDSA